MKKIQYPWLMMVVLFTSVNACAHAKGSSAPVPQGSDPPPVPNVITTKTTRSVLKDGVLISEQTKSFKCEGDTPDDVAKCKEFGKEDPGHCTQIPKGTNCIY